MIVSFSLTWNASHNLRTSTPTQNSNVRRVKRATAVLEIANDTSVLASRLAKYVNHGMGGAP
jgi:hypothetical protein